MFCLGLTLAMAARTSSGERVASNGLVNSTSRLSPRDLKMRPPPRAISGSISRRSARPVGFDQGAEVHHVERHHHDSRRLPQSFLAVATARLRAIGKSFVRRSSSGSAVRIVAASSPGLHIAASRPALRMDDDRAPRRQRSVFN